MKENESYFKDLPKKHNKRFACFFIFLLFFATITFYFGIKKFSQRNVPAIENALTVRDENAINFFDKANSSYPFEMPEIQRPSFLDQTCSIDEYGAVGDGKTLNTKAFFDAIADCSKNGGGIVAVPEGRWLTGAIKLIDNINLRIDKNATVIFSDNPDDYLPAVFSRYEGIEYIGYSPLIYAQDCSNIAITGEGSFDGQGKLWRPKNNDLIINSLYTMAKDNVPVDRRIFAHENNLLRPSFVQFVNCKSILLENFTIKNSPQWTIHPIYSSDITISHIRINTSGRNTDGIAIDSSRNVLVENSIISSGDDAIVIKSGRDKDGLRVNKPSENVLIRDCQIQEGHAGIAIGSEISGGINNVFIYNIAMDNTEFGLRFKSSIGRGGKIENIWAKNIIAQSVAQDAIQITTNYDSAYDKTYTDLPTIRNIFIDTFSAKKADNAIAMVGLDKNPITNISFRNLTIGSKNGARIFLANNLMLDNIDIQSPGTDPLFTFSDSKNIMLANTSCSSELPNCLKLKGEMTNDVLLKNNNILPNRIIFEGGATKDSVTLE